MSNKKIDWENLSFSYYQTECFVKIQYRNGAWGDIEFHTEPTINLHVAASSLHYGQACFEGMKAFKQKDGTVALFRPDENAKRMDLTAQRLVMEAPPLELFLEASKVLVEKNIDYVPPYGTGASMYIRPLLIGATPRIGVQPSEDFDFYILAMPVGPYYKHGFLPINAYVHEEYDRAAPRGVGNVKFSGNYAAGMKADQVSRAKGYPISLFLDSSTHSYIDEFGTSNFIGITPDKKYVTPDSVSILRSITNMSLQVLAKDLGFAVEKRPILFSEIENFTEIGACGTAAIITPIYSITRGEKTYTFGSENKAGETLTKLVKELQAIQYGEIEDRHEWMVEVK